LKVLIVISVVSTFCWDLHRAILVISCLILLFPATNLCFLLWCDQSRFKILIARLITIKIFNRIAALNIITQK